MKWLISIAGLIALIIALLPQIASSPLGKPLFIKALEQRSQSQVEVSSLRLSWFGPQRFQNLKWTHQAATGTIEELAIDAPFWSFSGPFNLKNGSITYKGGRVEQIEGQIEGNDFSLSGITLQGHISLKGQIYSKLHFHIVIDIQQFPLIVIDQQLHQLLGSTLDLAGTVSLEGGKGTIDLTVSTANLQTHLQGYLTEHAITLDKPLHKDSRLPIAP